MGRAAVQAPWTKIVVDDGREAPPFLWNDTNRPVHAGRGFLWLEAHAARRQSVAGSYARARYAKDAHACGTRYAYMIAKDSSRHDKGRSGGPSTATRGSDSAPTSPTGCDHLHLHLGTRLDGPRVDNPDGLLLWAGNAD